MSEQSMSAARQYRVARRIVCQRARRRCAKGFTLVEVLVAMVLLSIGLLGVAKLVLGAVHADDSAYLRSQATQMAYAMLDQMRANQTAAVGGSYTFADTRTAGNPGTTCTTAVCTPATIALADVYNWQQQLAAALPGFADGTKPYGTLTVTPGTPAAGSTLASVTVFWNDSMAQWYFGTPATTVPGAMAITLTTQL